MGAPACPCEIAQTRGLLSFLVEGMQHRVAGVAVLTFLVASALIAFVVGVAAGGLQTTQLECVIECGAKLQSSFSDSAHSSSGWGHHAPSGFHHPPPSSFHSAYHSRPMPRRGSSSGGGGNTAEAKKVMEQVRETMSQIQAINEHTGGHPNGRAIGQIHGLRA